VGVAVGEHVLDLAAALDDPVFAEPSLNAFMASGPDSWRTTRARIADLFGSDSPTESVAGRHLVRRSGVRMHLPIEVADYIDFYSSLDHATNLGRILRPADEPLKPNWRHLPVGYHGRAGTVVVTDTPIVRPVGQRKPPDRPEPVFGPSQRLDIEAEVGFVVGVPSRMGESVPTSAFAQHVFGVVLLNDWSARDIQGWEYAPLGPFLGKSFATSIGAWVTPLEALETARVSPPIQDPPPLPYLRDAEPWGLDLALAVDLNGHTISRPPFATTYWTPAQQLAHTTVNGASLRTGDLYASGTVSGPGPAEQGSLIELTWNGEQPITLPDGAQRSYLVDGDTVTIRASAPGRTGSRISLGAVRGTVHASPA
jgi:fumarylacetoacetase